MSPAAEKAHDAAVAAGRDFYTDPDTGLMVMTSLYLKNRGYCCGNICRHCPYDRGEQPTKN
ncbi:MAG: DUF5522 domain-containing protein [Ilumatobacteraceae bacterium]|jgi:hypothetical protein|nr:DUF5522 domain-containing protein [Ilumatobacteraceae bacterium]